VRVRDCDKGRLMDLKSLPQSKYDNKYIHQVIRS